MGAKKRPIYRIVAADSRVARDGKVIEEIGFYNPIVVPAEVRIDALKANKWLDNGAIPTDTVRSLFKQQGILKARHEAKANVEKKETAKKAPAKKATKKSGK